MKMGKDISKRLINFSLSALLACSVFSSSSQGYEGNDKKAPRAVDATELADEQRVLAEKIEHLKAVRIPEDLVKGYLASVEKLKDTKEGDGNLKVFAKSTLVKFQLDKIIEAMSSKFEEAGVADDIDIKVVIDPFALGHITFDFRRPDKLLTEKAEADEKSESWIVMRWTEHFSRPYETNRSKISVALPKEEHTFTLNIEFIPNGGNAKK